MCPSVLCTMYVLSALQHQKRASEPLDLLMLGSSRAGAKNQTQSSARAVGALNCRASPQSRVF